MNQETANYIMQRMSKYLDNSQMIKLKDTLDESLRQSVDGFLEKSSQELLDNQEAFNYGALEEFGLRDDHFEEEDQIISRETKDT